VGGRHRRAASTTPPAPRPRTCESIQPTQCLCVAKDTSLAPALYACPPPPPCSNPARPALTLPRRGLTVGDITGRATDPCCEAHGPGGRSHDLHHRLRSPLQRLQETAGVDYPPHSKGEPGTVILSRTARPVVSGPRFETGDRTRGSVVTCRSLPGPVQRRRARESRPAPPALRPPTPLVPGRICKGGYSVFTGASYCSSIG
jgi:hypothetical protein